MKRITGISSFHFAWLVLCHQYRQHFCVWNILLHVCINMFVELTAYGNWIMFSNGGHGKAVFPTSSLVKCA